MEIVDGGSVAAKSGMLAGDEILAVGNKKIQFWNECS